MVEFDSETLFNTAAAITSTIAALVFVFGVQFPYSPVSKVALVALFLAGVFALTQRTADTQLTLLGYAVVVTTAVALFAQLVGTFQAGSLVLAGGLLLIAGLLFGLRFRLDEDSHFLSSRQATALLAVVAVLAVVVVVVDVATGAVVYDLRLTGEVEVTDARIDPREDPVEVGTLVVRNPTPLPERADPPRYGACTAGNWSGITEPPDEEARERPVHADVHVEHPYNDHLLGFSRTTYAVALHLDERVRPGVTVPVRRTDGCPDDSTGDPYLAVFEHDRSRGFALGGG